MLNTNLYSNLAKFLVKAKRQTYAGQDDDATMSNPLLTESMQLEFSDGDWFYRDIYQGMSFFVGMETVYFQQKPVWAMSYSGGALPNLELYEAKKIYKFLRTALLCVSEDTPLRGPSKHVIDNMNYTMRFDGELLRFIGIEEVSLCNTCKYRLSFSGGVIS